MVKPTYQIETLKTMLEDETLSDEYNSAVRFALWIIEDYKRLLKNEQDEK